MIPLLLSVAFGLGVYLLYEGLTAPRPATTEGPRLRRVEEFLRRAGLHEVTPRDFVLFSLASGAVAGLLAQLLLGWGLVSAFAALLGAAAPLGYYARRHERRRAAVQAALADATAQLRDSLRAGLSVSDGLAALSRSGPEVLRPEFALLVGDLGVLGFAPALTRMRDRLADPVFDLIAGALILSDDLGGRHTGRVLDRLADATRAQLRVQEELRAYQERNKTSARIVAAMPLVVLVVIRRVNPAYLSLFDDWSGQLLLGAAAVSVALGYGAMLWLTRLPGEPRVLT